MAKVHNEKLMQNKNNGRFFPDDFGLRIPVIPEETIFAKKRYTSLSIVARVVSLVVLWNATRCDCLSSMRAGHVRYDR